MIYRTRITLLRRGQVIGEDEYGRPLYGPDTTTAFYGEVRPLAGEENTAAMQQVTTRFRMFLPPGVNADAVDRVDHLGLSYRIVGQPEPHTIGGRLHHLEVLVERVTG